MIEEMIKRAFEIRNATHIEHWKTKSYAQHKALGHFYEDFLDLIDELVETYQGQYDLVKLDFSGNESVDNPEKLVKDFSDFILKSRKLFPDETHLQNILDEMSALTYRTLYKLRFLK